MAKRTSVQLAKDITREVWAHPANAGRRPRAVVRAVGWQLRKRAGGQPRDLPFHGGVLRAYPDSNSASNVVYFTELYDYDEMRFLQRFVRPGDVVVDGGANIGTYTLLLAGLVGPAGTVHAFEPVRVAHERLQENVRLNRLSTVTVHRAALGAQTGTVTFRDDMDVSNRMVGAAGAGAARTVDVPMTTLDSVLGEAPVRVLKLDLEGAETMALRGAAGVLARTDAVLVEVIEHLLHKLGSSAAELLGLLGDAGLRAYRFDGVRQTWQPTDVSTHGNVVALARSGRRAVREAWGADALPGPPD